MNRPGDARSQRRPQEADWNRIARSAQFQHLLATKKMFIVPAFLFFLAYYLLLPILLGYAPRLMWASSRSRDSTDFSFRSEGSLLT